MIPKAGHDTPLLRDSVRGACRRAVLGASVTAHKRCAGACPRTRRDTDVYFFKSLIFVWDIRLGEGWEPRGINSEAKEKHLVKNFFS